MTNLPSVTPAAPRLRTVSCAIAGLALAPAAVALADTRIVEDRVGDVRDPLTERADIRAAIAGHAPGGALRHTVVMRWRQAVVPGIQINTRGGQTSPPEFLVTGRTVVNVQTGLTAGRARLTRPRRNRFVYTFSPRAIGDPDHYGWRAATASTLGGGGADLVPERGYVRHRRTNAD